MQKLNVMLSGKKTYALTAIAVVLTGLHALGYISDDLYTMLMTVTGAGAVATLRSAVTSSRKEEPPHAT